MLLKKITKLIIIFLTFFLLYFFYYYLPSLNKGSIQVNNLMINETQKIPNKENKNTFSNTEYKNQTHNGQIFTTRAAESYILQNNPNYINLVNPYSFTILKKDQSLIEIFSNKGFFDKEKKITTYEKNVVIKNKNYIITSNSAKHFSDKNLIIIDENVIMKDLTYGLSHILICDTVEINTITNVATAFMKSEKDQVIAKKFK